MEVQAIRSVRPVRAFFAGFLGLGGGYLYVSEPGLAAATVGGSLSIWALAAWTRLLVHSAAALWGSVALLLVVGLVSWIHPVVIAWRRPQLPRKPYNRWWCYVSWFLVCSAGGYQLTSHRAQLLGYEPFRSPTVSMSPTIERDDFFMADTWAYRGHGPQFGEIAVFELPDHPGVKYVKRVVGLPGDRVELRDSVLYRNGLPVAEPYLHPALPTAGYGRNFGPVSIGQDEVFFLGDFRDNSLDSREWGAVPVDHLHGRVQYVWFSLRPRPD
jgi:signal peptidase I